MTDNADLELRILVDPASEPIQGTVAQPDGTTHAFSGWLELTAALEAYRVVSPPPPPQGE